MQLFAHICKAVTMNIDKHQLSCLLHVPLLINMTGAHTSKNTHSLVVLFLWVIPWRFNFICRCFRTLYLFLLPAYTVYENGTDRVFGNVSKYNSDTGESPKRKNTTFSTWRKFEVKKHSFLLHRQSQFVHHSSNNMLQSVYPPHV